MTNKVLFLTRLPCKSLSLLAAPATRGPYQAAQTTLTNGSLAQATMAPATMAPAIMAPATMVPTTMAPANRAPYQAAPYQPPPATMTNDSTAPVTMGRYSQLRFSRYKRPNARPYYGTAQS